MSVNDTQVFRLAYEDRDDAACAAEARVRELEVENAELRAQLATCEAGTAKQGDIHVR